MVNGLEKFKEYFSNYTDQYVLIGGAACDIAFENNNSFFRATKDLDVVLVVEALTTEFLNAFLKFISNGKYRNKVKSNGKQQFYRFDKPKNNDYPLMIELFARNSFDIKNSKITFIKTNDFDTSLSAILLDDNYYNLLLRGRTVVNNLSILKPEYLIIFKIKAFLDLRFTEENGEPIDHLNIIKHKNDIFKLAIEFSFSKIIGLPETIKKEISHFLSIVAKEPYSKDLLNKYNIDNSLIVEILNDTFLYE